MEALDALLLPHAPCRCSEQFRAEGDYFLPPEDHNCSARVPGLIDETN
ncbi:hypothetical protein ACIBH1_44475 [Nonomuraea sp. NPDC050663]